MACLCFWKYFFQKKISPLNIKNIKLQNFKILISSKHLKHVWITLTLKFRREFLKYNRLEVRNFLIIFLFIVLEIFVWILNIVQVNIPLVSPHFQPFLRRIWHVFWSWGCTWCWSTWDWKSYELYWKYPSRTWNWSSCKCTTSTWQRNISSPYWQFEIPGYLSKLIY